MVLEVVLEVVLRVVLGVVLVVVLSVGLGTLICVRVGVRKSACVVRRGEIVVRGPWSLSWLSVVGLKLAGVVKGGNVVLAICFLSCFSVVVRRGAWVVRVKGEAWEGKVGVLASLPRCLSLPLSPESSFLATPVWD